MSVASALNERLTCFVRLYNSKPHQTTTAHLRQTVCRLPRHERRGTECFLARTARFTVRTPTHRLPQMGAFKSLASAIEEVIEVGEALIQSAGNEEEPESCQVKHGDVGGPWERTRTGGVSGFLLPTFLCRAPRRKSPWGSKEK
jgi:hypothetical protein